MLESLEYVTTTIFLLEMMVKVIATGFIINGPESYLRFGYNVVDFIIVLASVISLFPLNVHLDILKIMRTVRLLRPLRVISRSTSLKLSI